MGTLSIGNSDFISHVNHRLVLQAVRVMQPTYRAEVSRATNLKPATVTGIVTDLIQAGLLEETSAPPPPVGAQGGRPPLMLRVRASVRHILAVDLEPDVLRVGVFDLDIQSKAYLERIINRLSEPPQILQKMAELCREVCEIAGLDTVHGAAVSLPGLIDPKAGVLLSSTNMPKWKDVPIAAFLENELGVPVRVDRSVRLAALYEDWVATQEQNTIKLVLSVRTGVGVSMIRHGELYIGARGYDGEIGHTVIDPQGKVCECGNRGCLETFVSASAVIRRAQALLDAGEGKAIRAAIEAGEQLRPELVYELASTGDVECADLVRDIGRYLGMAATNLINLLDPDTLIISGAIDTAGELLLDAVRSYVRAHALPRTAEHVEVRLAAAKELTPLRGAAVLLARDLFVLPRLQHMPGAV